VSIAAILAAIRQGDIGIQHVSSPSSELIRRLLAATTNPDTADTSTSVLCNIVSRMGSELPHQVRKCLLQALLDIVQQGPAPKTIPLSTAAAGGAELPHRAATVSTSATGRSAEVREGDNTATQVPRGLQAWAYAAVCRLASAANVASADSHDDSHATRAPTSPASGGGSVSSLPCMGEAPMACKSRALPDGMSRHRNPAFVTAVDARGQLTRAMGGEDHLFKSLLPAPPAPDGLKVDCERQPFATLRASRVVAEPSPIPHRFYDRMSAPSWSCVSDLGVVGSMWTMEDVERECGKGMTARWALAATTVGELVAGDAALGSMLADSTAAMVCAPAVTCMCVVPCQLKCLFSMNGACRVLTLVSLLLCRWDSDSW
jgi:hypothetical protein